jgi:succinyl-CoA synthetase beta subunit
MGRVGVSVPIVVRLSGTNAEEGRAILDANGLHAVATMDEAAAKVVAAAAA